MSLNPRLTHWRGRRVWIIGGSTGIGLALARALLARGARLAVSARDESRMRAAFAGDAGVVLASADVTRPESLVAAHANIRAQLAELDCVVLMAGTYFPTRAWELDAHSTRRIVTTNLIGIMDAVSVALPDMLRRQSGALVIVSSVAGYRGLPNALLYGATKAALINFAETLYLDVAPRGVGVYLMNPGFVATPLTAQNTFKMPALLTPEAAAERILAGLAAGRFETHFPRRFTSWLKLGRVLPYRWYFAAVRRFVGGEAS